MKPSLLDAVSLATLLRRAGGLLTAASLLGASLAPGEEPNAVEEIAKYRQMLEDGNPAELMEMQGETLWSTPRGPRQASLERCDLGLGPGKLEGAYARLPRYFPDTGRVEDVESRLVSCMMMLQGLSREEATRGWYARNSDLEALTTFVAGRSKGYAIDVSVQHPREAQLYAIGEEIFWRRSGPLDFGCSTCHSLDERRIRLQELPNLASVAGARASMPGWPAYRLSQAAVWTMERRLIDCVRQMRWPEPEYLSDTLIALQVYLQKNANGAAMRGPGIRR